MPRWSPGRMQPPLRARSFPSDRRYRSLSASAIRPVRHSAPLQSSIIARPVGGPCRFLRADSQRRSMARSRNYPMCENALTEALTHRDFSELAMLGVLPAFLFGSTPDAEPSHLG